MRLFAGLGVFDSGFDEDHAELQGRNISVSEARERTAGPRPSFGGPRNFGPPAEPMNVTILI